MEPQDEKKPKFNRMIAEMLVLVALFFGLIIGVQALQGRNHPPSYNPFGAIWIPK